VLHYTLRKQLSMVVDPAMPLHVPAGSFEFACVSPAPPDRMLTGKMAALPFVVVEGQDSLSSLETPASNAHGNPDILFQSWRDAVVSAFPGTDRPWPVFREDDGLRRISRVIIFKPLISNSHIPSTAVQVSRATHRLAVG